MIRAECVWISVTTLVLDHNCQHCVKAESVSHQNMCHQWLFSSTIVIQIQFHSNDSINAIGTPFTRFYIDDG